MRLVTEKRKEELEGIAAVDETRKDKVAGTLWGLLTLEREFPKDKASWKLLARKAREFLKKAGCDYAEVLNKL